MNKNERNGLVSAFQHLSMSPEGQLVMQYLEAQFLYPNPKLTDVCGGRVPSNDEILGQHRVILHMKAMMDQPVE